MSEQNAIARAEASLAAIQQKLERVLDQYQKLVEAHLDMRARHDELMHERADLISNNEQARHRVEAMLSRLKDMEPRV